MNKLTQQEAQDLIELVRSQLKVHPYTHLRFGQHLWNSIPKEMLEYYIVYEHFLYSDKLIPIGYEKDVDFFYMTDQNKVIETFYKYFFCEEK